MNKRTYTLSTTIERRAAASDCLSAPDGWVCTIDEPGRTLEQNDAQWPILEAFSKQLKWLVNGEFVELEAKEFKEVLSAAFYEENVRLAAGLNGGVVMLGHSTSKMKKKEFSEWLDFLHAVAAHKGVNLEPVPE